MSGQSLVVQSQYGFETLGIKLLTYSQAGFMLLRSAMTMLYCIRDGLETAPLDSWLCSGMRATVSCTSPFSISFLFSCGMEKILQKY